MVVEHAVDLRPWNTLSLPGRAARYLRITDAAQLADPALADGPRFVLGGGSNLVLRGDFSGLVLHIAIPGRELLPSDDDACYLAAGAGENWHDFVQWTLLQGCPGLENLSLIPGTVGAAPIQNIGAYGLEVSERLHSVEAWDFNSRCFRTFPAEDCRFAYRDSRFKQEGRHLDGSLVITRVIFRLPKNWQPNCAYADVAGELRAAGVAAPRPLDIAQAVIAVRRRKLPDPALVPNAGSFFHNPLLEAESAAQLLRDFPEMPHYPQADGRIKVAAGWLIEKAGWKGRNLGPVGMYEKQALVLVNRGGACGADVQRTMQAVQEAVRERFAVELTPEPVFL